MPAATPAGPVLVIDDDATGCKLVQELLGLDGYVVRAAPTAETGFVLAVSARPALILLNLHFGTGLDGIEVARRLKADPRTAAIPLVAFTALTEREVELEAKRLGFAAFLTKPFDATTLRETVRRYVRQG